LRKRLADREQVPPFVVFSDATLAEMAARRPRDAAGLLSVNGVGQRKLERYGEDFLALLIDY
jgi:ATP-dependent DNA helicase RecQ